MVRERSRSPLERKSDKRSRRSRSRSPLRRHDRSSGDGPNRNGKKREREFRERSISPKDRRHPEKERDSRRSRSPQPVRKHDHEKRKDYNRHQDGSKTEKTRQSPPKIDMNSLANAEEDMMKMMGFGNFDTTKNKKVEGNMDGMAKVNKPRKFRQYMNRRGGFNRPLEYIA